MFTCALDGDFQVEQDVAASKRKVGGMREAEPYN